MVACCHGQPAHALSEKEIESKAYALASAGRYKQLIQLVEPQIILKPRNAELYGYRAWAYLNQHHEKEALADLQTLFRLEPGNESFLHVREQAFMVTGQFARALADCNKMLALHPDDPTWYARRATCEAHLSDRQSSAADLNKALKIDPNNYDALMCQYEGCIERLDENGALISLNRILSTHPSDSAVLLLRAGLLEVLGHSPEAMNDVSKSLVSDPLNWQSREFRAKLKWEMGDKKSAIKDYDIAISSTLGSTRCVLLEHRGRMYEDLGDAQHALADYSEAVRLSGHDANIAMFLMNRGRVNANLGNFQSAITDYSAVLEKTPQHLVARQERAAAFFAAHKYEDAVQDYTKLIEMDRDSRWFVGRAKAERKQGKAALAAHDEAQAALFHK